MIYPRELRFNGVLRSSRRTIRARCRLPPNHALLHRATRNFRCSFRPGPGAQAESLYLPFPELRLGDALHAVHWLLAPEQPDRPSYPIARDLLLCQVHADFFRQMVRHERPYLSPAPVGAEDTSSASSAKKPITASGSRLLQASSKASAARNSSALSSPWDIRSSIKRGSRFAFEAVPRDWGKRERDSSITRTTICLYLPSRERSPSSSSWSIFSMEWSSW